MDYAIQNLSLIAWVLSLTLILHRKTLHGVAGYILSLDEEVFVPQPLVGSPADVNFTTGLPGSDFMHVPVFRMQVLSSS